MNLTALLVACREVGIQKEMRWTPRPTMYVGAAVIREIMMARRAVLMWSACGHCLFAQGLITEPKWQYTALWMLTSYVFLLR